MSERLMREGLRHTYAGMKDEVFFQAIDATGGWPVGYQYVGFEHSDTRDAGFTNLLRNDGWWTVVYSADDYYMWKLSPEAVQRIAAAAISRCAGFAARTPTDKLIIKNSRGYSAAMQAQGAKE